MTTSVTTLAATREGADVLRRLPLETEIFVKWTRLSNDFQASVKRPGGQPQAALSQRDHAKIFQALRTPRPCLLCGAPPAMAGLFWPDRLALWGGTPGKGRVIAYALCHRCRALPDLTLRVEARLQASIVGRRN